MSKIYQYFVEGEYFFGEYIWAKYVLHIICLFIIFMYFFSHINITRFNSNRIIKEKGVMPFCGLRL